MADGGPSPGDLTPHGLGWRAVLESRRVRVTITKLRRGSGGLKAYVEVEYARPKADGGGHLLLAGEWLNLGSGRDRASLANRLRERQNGVEWRNVLDAVCIEVQRRDDQGDPVVIIGLLAAMADVMPELGETLRASLVGGAGQGTPPWEIE